jgi:hypothetical protein
MSRRTCASRHSTRRCVTGSSCHRTDKDIVIVDIDQASLAAIAPLVHVAKDDSRIGLPFKTHRHPDDRLTQLDEAVGDRVDGIKGQTLEKRYYRLKP